MIIIATQDYKPFYGFKASARHKALASTRLLESRITLHLSLPLSTGVLHKWSCHNSTFIGEHNSHLVSNVFAYTARSITDLHTYLAITTDNLWITSVVLYTAGHLINSWDFVYMYVSYIHLCCCYLQHLYILHVIEELNAVDYQQ